MICNLRLPDENDIYLVRYRKKIVVYVLYAPVDTKLNRNRLHEHSIDYFYGYDIPYCCWRHGCSSVD